MTDIISRRAVFTTEWFSIEEKMLAQSSAPYFSLSCPDYVSIVALTGNDELVLVRQFRPALEKSMLEIPGGHVESSESAVVAAGRELIEETGYVADSLEMMGVVMPDSGRLSNRLHCFFTRVGNPSGSWQPEPGLEVITVPSAKILQSIGAATPILTHAQCLAAIGMAVLQAKL